LPQLSQIRIRSIEPQPNAGPCQTRAFNAKISQKAAAINRAKKISNGLRAQYDRQINPMAALDFRKIGILGGMSAAQHDALAKYGAAVEFSAGQGIVEQGSNSTALFLVLKGKVGVYATDGQGGQIHLRTIRSGEHFGEVGWLNADMRTASVRAILQSTLFKLEAKALEELMRTPELAAPLLYALCFSLAARLASTTRKVVEIQEIINHFRLV
jgi:CRP-like cAMP-binding protein